MRPLLPSARSTASPTSGIGPGPGSVRTSYQSSRKWPSTGDSRFLIMFFWCLKVVLLPRVYSEIRRPRAQWPLGRRGEPRFAWGPVFSAVCVASRTLAGGSSQPTPSAPLDVLIRLGRGRRGRADGAGRQFERALARQNVTSGAAAAKAPATSTARHVPYLLYTS
jgi:hypothetical protein